SINGGIAPRWRGDGKELFYLSADQRMMAVEIVATPTFEAGIPKPLFPVQVVAPGPVVRTHYAVTSDGQRFLVVAPLGSQTMAGTQMVLNWSAEAKRR